MFQKILQGGGGASSFQFSTEEQKTNLKWIDGKDIYIKTFVITNSTTSITMPTDIDKIINYEGMRYWNASNVNGYCTPYYASEKDFIHIYFDNGIMTITKGSSSSMTESYVTVYYTKK